MMALPVSGSWPTVYLPSHRPSFRFRMFPSPFARLFDIKSAPFDNEQYRNQEDKATKKPNSYQKVIICAGCPIFVYGGAISALPGAFFFGYSGAIFGQLKVFFIVYGSSKYACLALPVLRDVITLVFSQNGHKAPPKSLGRLRLREPRRQPL